MAIYHLCCKAISRSSGRSAVAAAAYRAGQKLVDERTGITYDFTHKAGAKPVELVLPDDAPAWAADREKLWNAAEKAERRKDACTAREFEGALPAELSEVQRLQLVLEYARDMVKRERCAVDASIHEPSPEGDDRNYHVHAMRTTRRLEADGLGAKLDTEKAGRQRRADLKEWRRRWAEMVNRALEAAGIQEKVDHRSLKDQGIGRAPTFHRGVAVTAIERKYLADEPVTEVGQRLADLLTSNAAKIEIQQIDAEHALVMVAILEEKRDGIRAAALRRINEYGTKTDGNLRAASHNASDPQRDPQRIAEACAAFNIANRDRGLAQEFVEQVGQLARAFIIKVSPVVERVMSWISGIEFRKGGEATWAGMVEASPVAPSTAPILTNYRENAREQSLRIYSHATQQVVTDKGITPEQELANLKASLDQRGMKVTIAMVGGQLVGPVEVIGQHYLVQNLGSDQRVIHEVAALPTGLTSGDTLDALYDLNPDGSVRTPVVVVNGDDRPDDSGDGPAGPEAPGSRGKFRP